jgi:hypothetical protein
MPPEEPFWGQLRPFALQGGETCHIPPRMSYSTDLDSSFAAQAKEVQQAVRGLTPGQKVIAYWWADGAGTPTPAGHWHAILGEWSERKGLSLAETAQAYALISIAMADAFIGCWKSKYEVNLLRPMTYIHRALGDFNWQPLIKTPSFPEYPSGHSVVSGAAAEVLTQLLGEESFTDNANTDLGYAPRPFAHFHAAAEEAGISRLYGGIHFREAIDNGLEQGRCIGKNTLQRVNISSVGVKP